MPRRGKFRTKIKRGSKTYYVIRDRRGRFADFQRVDRAARADRRKRAKTRVRPGQGWRGDTAR